MAKPNSKCLKKYGYIEGIKTEFNEFIKIKDYTETKSDFKKCHNQVWISFKLGSSNDYNMNMTKYFGVHCASVALSDTVVYWCTA